MVQEIFIEADMLVVKIVDIFREVNSKICVYVENKLGVDVSMDI